MITYDYDGFRLFAIALSIVLALLLASEFVYLMRHKPWAIEMMVSRVTIFFFNLAAGYTSYLRLEEPGDNVVLVRLAGHILGILLVLVAWSIRRDRRKQGEFP